MDTKSCEVKFFARANARDFLFNVSRETIFLSNTTTFHFVSRETFLKNYYFILKFIQNGDIILNVRKIL